MRILRWVTAGLFSVVLCGYLLFSWNEHKNKDDTYPHMELESQELTVSISVTEEELLAGVTAYDEKDGDLTDRVFIESVSKFIQPGLCRVTYAVADGDCHVAKASQLIRYSDYTPPRIYLNMPSVFYADDKVNIRDQIGAVDCIDGDISDRVTVVEANSSGLAAGSYKLSVQVTNSRGDQAYLDLPIFVESVGRRGPEIQLKEALIYLKTGEKPDFETYIDKVFSQGQPMKNYDVTVTTNFDSRKPGVYVVHYYISDLGGVEGHTALTVVVEE